MERDLVFAYVDGVGQISLVDGVVRAELMAITGMEEGKPILVRSGGLAMSLPAMLKLHGQFGQLINELLQKGVLQQSDAPASRGDGKGAPESKAAKKALA